MRRVDMCSSPAPLFVVVKQGACACIDTDRHLTSPVLDPARRPTWRPTARGLGRTAMGAAPRRTRRRFGSGTAACCWAAATLTWRLSGRARRIGAPAAAAMTMKMRRMRRRVAARARVTAARRARRPAKARRLSGHAARATRVSDVEVL